MNKTNLKSVIAFTMALTLAVPCMTYSVNTASNMTYAADEENDKLSEIASSLGADTDYFNLGLSNYTPNTCYEKAAAYLKEIIPANINASSYVDSYFKNFETNKYNSYSASELASEGIKDGMNIISVLTHNGIIKPSDIQSGAENLSDITFDNDVNDALVCYSINLNKKLKAQEAHEMYIYSKEEQVKKLLELAEKATNEKRFFYMSLCTDKKYDSFTGMGMTTGNWSFQNKSYDKCIITKSIFYDYLKCFYINSETFDIYNDLYRDSDEIAALYSTDNDNLLNYHGMINPCEYESEYDITNMSIRSGSSGFVYDISVKGRNGETSYYKGDYGQSIRNIEKKARLPFSMSSMDSMSIDAKYDESTSGMYNIENPLYLKLKKEYWNINVSMSSSDFKTDVFRDKITITDTDTKGRTTEYDGIINDDKNNKFIEFYGKTSGDTTIELINENECFISGSDISVSLLMDSEIDPDSTVFDKTRYTIVNAKNGAVVKYDRENKTSSIFIDTNGDGVYDEEVKKGDVNNDGAIDASDASFVLSGYSAESSGKKSFVDSNTGDFNGDGVVNSSDASAILNYYAEISSGKNN